MAEKNERNDCPDDDPHGGNPGIMISAMLIGCIALAVIGFLILFVMVPKDKEAERAEAVYTEPVEARKTEADDRKGLPEEKAVVSDDERHETEDVPDTAAVSSESALEETRALAGKIKSAAADYGYDLDVVGNEDGTVTIRYGLMSKSFTKDELEKIYENYMTGNLSVNQLIRLMF